MIEKAKLGWFYSISALFIALTCYLSIHNFLWINVLPILLIVLLLGIFSTDKILLIAVFCTPLAINLNDLTGGLGISLPTEPLLLGVTLLFFFRMLYRADFDKKILKHAITIAILINLLWIFITSLTSEMPIVSFKFLAARIWFIVPCFFLATQLFKQQINMSRFMWLYVVPLIIVIFYTLINHARHNFGDDPAHWVMSPFYNDHTAYGAILAMYYPFLFGLIFDKSKSFNIRMAATFSFVIFSAAIVFSYTRATWISLVAALIVYGLMSLKVKFKYLLYAFFLVVGVLLYFQTDIVMKLESNRQDTSENFGEHIQSMSNITTDASNLERLNRWNSAFRMFEERPILGWGPGTYSFQYAPFQRSDEKTIISTNMGDMGNAHSEYIGPLSESGIFGALTFIAIMLIVLSTGFRLYYTLEQGSLRTIVLTVTLGLFTYFVHGTLNNFLDTDKASLPFWGMIAVIVAADVYHKNQLKKSDQ